MRIMKAPNGSKIQGTAETIPGLAAGTLEEGEDEISYTGGTDVDWNGQATDEIVGASVFVDEDDNRWLQHPLIPDDAEPLTDETLLAFGNEERVGKLLDQLYLTQKASEDAGISMLLTRHAIADTRKVHSRLKERSLALKERDLARVSA